MCRNAGKRAGCIPARRPLRHSRCRADSAQAYRRRRDAAAPSRGSAALCLQPRLRSLSRTRLSSGLLHWQDGSRSSPHCVLPVAASTTITPVICGCSEQKYSYEPGVVNVNENLPSVSSAFDLNCFPVAATVCGMSSSLYHVTVAPAFTVRRGGSNVKLSIFAVASAAPTGEARKRSPATRTALKLAAAEAAAGTFLVVIVGASALQPLIDDREALFALLEGDARHAEQAAQLLVRDFHRARRRSAAGRRLRESGGARSVEADVAFDLLHDLVDVAVEHGHGAEPLHQLERAA